MTINGGQSHAVGYIGQKFRIVVDEEAPKGTIKRVIGWSNVEQQTVLDSLNTGPGWSNARFEVVEDPETEGAT